MFLKLRPLLGGLVFFVGLEFIALKKEAVLVVASCLFFMSLFEGRKIGGKWFFSILPIFFTLSSTALLYLIARGYEQQIFILLASGMYYLSLLGASRLGKYIEDQTARGMNMAATSATIFFTYASAYGIYLNFLVPLYVLMVVYLLVTLFVSYQHFSIIYPLNVKNKKNSGKIIWIYSFLLALVMMELIWAMNFWPFGYLTTGTVALILYYVLWDMTQSYFLNLLSKKRVVANMIFFSVLILMVLASSKWIPVI